MTRGIHGNTKYRKRIKIEAPRSSGHLDGLYCYHESGPVTLKKMGGKREISGMGGVLGTWEWKCRVWEGVGKDVGEGKMCWRVCCGVKCLDLMLLD